MKAAECDTYEKLRNHAIDVYTQYLKQYEDVQTIQDDHSAYRALRAMVINTFKHPDCKHLRPLVADAFNLRRNTNCDYLADCFHRAIVKHLVFTKVV